MLYQRLFLSTLSKGVKTYFQTSPNLTPEIKIVSKSVIGIHTTFRTATLSSFGMKVLYEDTLFQADRAIFLTQTDRRFSKNHVFGRRGPPNVLIKFAYIIALTDYERYFSLPCVGNVKNTVI